MTVSRNGMKAFEGLAEENGLLTIPGSFFDPHQEQQLRVSFV
jgi:aspartate/methionine/tyrosine aminotransferase